MKNALILLLLPLSACTSVPDSIVQRPTSTRPEARYAAAPAANGAIFQAASYRPLFEDRRARHVGDLLVIVINEKTSAGKTGSDTASKAGSASFSVGKLLGFGASTAAKLGLETKGANKFEDKDASSSSNNFTGTLSVTVTEVLPNGYLAVSGEKQVAFDKGNEYIRFSGVVNPDSILNGNQVASTQVADARLEYRSNTRVDPVEVASQLGRFVLSVLPF
ncbi:MAG: flagellar basal body L-ring protein FlgH [Noviherbaspirillum sp.]